MHDQYIEDEVFSKKDYTVIPFSKAGYDNCQFINCSFANTDLSGTSFTECSFEGCDLTMAALNKTAFKDVSFKDCKLLGLHFDDCDPFLFEVSFTDCMLNMSFFYKRKLVKTKFIKDTAECRRHLPAKTAWLKGVGYLDCVLTAESTEAGKPSIGILSHVNPNECGHNTLAINEGCELSAGENLKFHPASHFSAEDLIPEVMNLAQGAVVPKEVYLKYDARKIGVTITQKIYKEMEQEASDKVEKPALDFLNASAIQMAFNHQNIDSIAERGFLNQHQYKSSNGALDPKMRANAEDSFLGYKLEETYEENLANPANKVRPKYSYLGLPDTDFKNHPMYKGHAALSPYYGNVFAVFAPEVKD
ncbi:MAG: hypothetical protein EOP04_23600, partial [Proteobacteria bacterium]